MALFSRPRSGNARNGGVSLQIMSDLHLEFLESYLEFNIPRKAPYLLLGGDIGQLAQYDKFSAFLQHQCRVFDHVYLVLGNHEFYRLDRTQTLERAVSLCAEMRNLTLLHRTRVDISETVSLLGCTLHSRISHEQRGSISRGINDFKLIKDWTVEDHNNEHDGDLQWLKQEVEKISRDTPKRRIVIATHHAPSFQHTADPKYASNGLRSAFATEIIRNDLPRWSGKETIKYWIFGHTHWCAEFKINGIQLLSNQRGYVRGTQITEKPNRSLLTSFTSTLLREPREKDFDVQKCITLD